MAGLRFPLVLIPRFSTFSGQQSFATIGMDVTPFELIVIHLWRAAVVGSGSTFAFSFEQSTDQDKWTTNGQFPFDPGIDTEVQVLTPVEHRFLRAVVEIKDAPGTVTCYAVGYAERRRD